MIKKKNLTHKNNVVIYIVINIYFIYCELICYSKIDRLHCSTENKGTNFNYINYNSSEKGFKYKYITYLWDIYVQLS